MATFKEYLYNHRITDKGTPPTHLTFGSKYSAKYNVSDTDKLIKIYSKQLPNIPENDRCLLEIQHDPSIFMLDIDWDQKCKNRAYELDHIVNIGTCIIDLMKEVNEIDLDDKTYTFHIHEKNAPTERDNGLYKDGVHIYFPKIVMCLATKKLLFNLIVDKVSTEVGFENILETDTKKIFDPASYRNALYMYYSHKPGRTPYKLTYIHPVGVVDSTKYNPHVLINLYSSRRNTENDINFLLTIKEPPKHNMPAISKLKKQTPTRTLTDGMLATINGLVDHLSIDRADDYREWISIGMLLKNIHDSLLPVWIRFSKKSPKFTSIHECEKKWESFSVNENIVDAAKISTLYNYIRYDNGVEIPYELTACDIEYYNHLCSTIPRSIIKYIDTPTHYDAAELFYYIFKNQYKCTDLKACKWYKFNNARWVKVNNGGQLLTSITVTLVGVIKQYLTRLIRNDGDASGNNAYANLAIENLKTTPFKKHVITELSSMFYDDTFEQRLDSYKHLLSFNNGVYDLDKMEFRLSTSEDYLEKSTNIDYIEYTEDDEQVLFIEDYFTKVQTNEDMRTYLLNILAKSLYGGNTRHVFNIFTGVGSNGKTTTINLLESTMGDYYATASSAILTNKRSCSNNASPAFAILKGARVVVISEIETNETIQVGILKELTGGDRLIARELYCNPIYFYPMFNFMLLCNRLPKLSISDEATFRRLEVLPWKSKFVREPREDKPNEFIRDDDLVPKLKASASAFMWLLINKYFIPNNKQVPIPPSVKYTTDRYRGDSNIYAEFIARRLIKDDDVCISVKDGYDLFKQDCADYYGNGSIPGRREFIDQLRLLDIELQEMKHVLHIMGYGFKEDDADITDIK